MPKGLIEDAEILGETHLLAECGVCDAPKSLSSGFYLYATAHDETCELITGSDFGCVEFQSKDVCDT